jgi:hypothetical protein
MHGHWPKWPENPTNPSGMRTTIEQWLEVIPVGYHGLAHTFWEDGAIRFAKYPVTQGNSGVLGGSKAGYPRPLLCPEPPPNGCRFELAWHDGNSWRMTSLEEAVLGDPPLMEKAQKALAAALSELASCEENGRNPLKLHEAASIVVALEESAKLGASNNAVALAFLAGFRFSTCYYLNRNWPVIRQGTILQSGRKPRDPVWTEIISAALERHGGITPTELLKAIGGCRVFDDHNAEKDLFFEQPAGPFDDWEFNVNFVLPSIEWKTFVAIVGNQKRARRR